MMDWDGSLAAAISSLKSMYTPLIWSSTVAHMSLFFWDTSVCWEDPPGHASCQASLGKGLVHLFIFLCFPILRFSLKIRYMQFLMLVCISRVKSSLRLDINEFLNFKYSSLLESPGNTCSSSIAKQHPSQIRPLHAHPPVFFKIESLVHTGGFSYFIYICIHR